MLQLLVNTNIESTVWDTDSLQMVGQSSENDRNMGGASQQHLTRLVVCGYCYCFYFTIIIVTIINYMFRYF